MRPINRWDRVTGYVLLVIGLVTAWSSVHLSMGKLRHPGPGFFPFGLALCLILLSLALIFRHWKKDDSPTAFWPGRTWLRPLLGVTILLSYAGGQTDCGGNHPSEMIAQIKAKRLIPIGVALEKRDPAIPEVPTFKELGYNVVSVGSVKGVAAPKGTAPEVIAYLTERFKKVCDDPEFIKEMKDIGQPVMYLGPEAFGKFLQQGFQEFGKLIKEFNIKLE